MELCGYRGRSIWEELVEEKEYVQDTLDDKN